MASQDDTTTRRKILIAAMKAAGVIAAPAGLVDSAAGYVRTDSQRGTLADEIGRFRADLEVISAGFEIYPAESIMPMIYGVWENIDAFRESRTHPRIQEFKARTAFYAGTLSTTLGDATDGARWFDVGHGYAILAGDHGLKSIGHSREAIAGLYWGRSNNRVLADARLALDNAHTPGERGMAFMAEARAVGESQQGKSKVVKTIEAALECAIPKSGEAPRPDAWWTHQAEMMAAIALSRYGGMMGAITDYTANAMQGLPRNAVLLRTHAQLTLADAYASDQEYDEAAGRALSALKAVPPEHRQPVLLGRAYGLLKRIQARAGQPMAAARLAHGLRALQRQA